MPSNFQAVSTVEIRSLILLGPTPSYNPIAMIFRSRARNDECEDGTLALPKSGQRPCLQSVSQTETVPSSTVEEEMMIPSGSFVATDLCSLPCFVLLLATHRKSFGLGTAPRGRLVQRLFRFLCSLVARVTLQF